MNETKVEEFVVLSERACVSKQLHDDVFAEVSAAVKAMPAGAAWKTEKLCGRELWGRLSREQRRDAGRVVCYLVRTGRVALDFAVCPYYHPKLFMHVGDDTPSHAKCSRFPC